MTKDEVTLLFCPEVLVVFEEEVRSARQHCLVAKGTLAGARLQHADSWGYSIAVYERPTAVLPVAYVTPGDLAGKIRPATADEERRWISLGEKAGDG